MEVIIRHSPITCNGSICSTYGNRPYPSASIALAVPKVARQRARLRMQTKHTVAPRDSAFQLWQPAMSTCAFPSAHEKKGLPIIPLPIFKTYGCGLAQLLIKIYFL